MNTFLSKIEKEAIQKMPIRAFEGKTYTIDSYKKIRKIIEKLQKADVLGFDTETRPVFKKHQSNQVALLQLSCENEAFLFRLNKIGLPDELTEILSNPNIIKSGVAIRDDIKDLRKLNDFAPAGFAELQTIVNNYGIEDAGLKKLTANILGFRISKSEQLSNWERNRLSEKQKKYAATDAWVGYMIYKKLQDYNPSLL
jgi:ribonuclease D